MSNPLKAIGKVFKSVVKGIVKFVKKIAPIVLMVGAAYFTAGALSGAFAAGGSGSIFGTMGSAIKSGFSSVGGLFKTVATNVSGMFTGTAAATGTTVASTGAVTGSGVAGAAGAINTTAGAAGTLSASGFVAPSVTAAASGASAGSGLLAGAAKLGKGAVSYLGSNPAALTMAGNALSGMAQGSAAKDVADTQAMSEKERLAFEKQKHEDSLKFNGSFYGVDADGSGNGDTLSTGYNPGTETNQTLNGAMDQQFAESSNAAVGQDANGNPVDQFGNIIYQNVGYA